MTGARRRPVGPTRFERAASFERGPWSRSLPARRKRRIDRWFVPPRRNEPPTPTGRMDVAPTGRVDSEQIEAMRDLLGVVRAIYAASKERGASRYQLTKISRVGKQLSDAIERAAALSVERVEALRQAEAATREVVELIDSLTPAEPMLLAAKSRVTGGGAALKKRREER